MNKKIAMIGISIAVGSAMLFATAFASMAGTSGYDTYKSAIKNTMVVKSFTADSKVTVNDNGSTLINADFAVKQNRDTNSMSQSINVKTGDSTKSTELYSQDGKTITKNSDSDVYSVTSMPTGKNGEYGRIKMKPEQDKSDPQIMDDGEKVMDALVGNLQNYVLVDTKSDGTKEISAQLTNSQIPALANAVTSFLVKRVGDAKIMGPQKINSVNSNLLGSMPKLTSDISIDSADMKAELDKDNFVTNQVGNIVISGKDAAGSSHSITVSIGISLSGFNSTTPDTVDLTGKQVKTIQMKKFRTSDNSDNNGIDEDNE